MSDNPLATWPDLNRAITEADEARCLELLELEMKGKRRKEFALRIQSRLNRVRSQRERAELIERLKGND